MKKLATGFLLLILCTGGFAQNSLVKLWDYRSGGTQNEWLRAIQQTADGGYILGGSSNSGIGCDKTQPRWDTASATSIYYRGDYWVVKLNQIGWRQWERRFGGIGIDELSALMQTDDGGYILGGSSQSGISGDKTQANWDTATNPTLDYWIVKIDALGNKQWDKRFGGIGNDGLTSIQQTADGGYILGGTSSSDSTGDKTQYSWGNHDFWLVKTDRFGNKQWDKRFGGTYSDKLMSLKQTADGGYILGGYSGSDINGDKTQPNWGGGDYWVVKIDSFGNKQWDKRFGGTGYDDFDKLEVTDDGGYILGGISQSDSGGDKTQPHWGGNDYWIVKTDRFGNKEWDKRFGGTGIEDDFNSISKTNDGGYLLGGCSYSDSTGDKTEKNYGEEQTWVVKTDRFGNKEWDKTVRLWAHEEVGFALQSKDGGYVFANETEAGVSGEKIHSSCGGQDFWIIKYRIPMQDSTTTANASCHDLCNGDATVFATYGITPYSYRWLPGNETTATILNLCAGTYYVTITDAAGYTLIDSVVVEQPVASNDSVAITANQTVFCLGDSAHICATPGFGGYNWSNGETTDCIWVKQTGNYSVTATSIINGCPVVSNQIVVSAYSIPVSISSSGDTLIASHAQTYQWYLNGSPIIGATDSVYIATQVGSYTVEVIDSNGCAATSSPVLVSGIENVTEDDVVSVFPNPTQNNWQLTVGNNLLGGTAEVFDANGRVVVSSKIKEQSSKIEFDGARGIYLLRVSSARSSVVRKLVRL